jgi:uncharacterized protein (DUF885 family)
MRIKALVLTVVLIALVQPTTLRLRSQSDPVADLKAFIDDFVGSNRTGGGGLPAGGDMGAASFAQQLAHTKQQLARLRAIDHARLTGDDLIDWRFAESILVGRELAQERIQAWKKDPRVYMAFRGLSATIERPGDPDSKVGAVLATLKLVPVQLDNGRKNIDVFVPRFQELSVFMAKGAADLFEKDVVRFADQVPAFRADVLAANKNAREALTRYIQFLENELPRRPRGGFAIGTATYDAMLKGQYLLPYDSESLYQFAWNEFNRTVRELEKVAREIDPKKTWQQLAAEIKHEGPDPTREIEAHQEWVNKARNHILSKNLIPIPWKERVDVVPRDEYLRKTSYYGNFSMAASRPPAPDGTLIGQWQINPFDPQWDEQAKRDYILEHDWGVIIVTAPHETYGGHHVQGLYQMHSPRKLRRTQSISIFSEGWGLYNEQLMQETGFFPDERIHLRQLQLRLWRNARVVYDVGMHTGKLSYDEAVKLMTDRVGFLKWAAELEVDGSAEQPGYRIGYFMGMSEILKMREECRQKMGARFTLPDFHSRLLQAGSMPPALMREALMASLSSN